MKIILDTDSTNPEYNGECDYAVVDLSPTLVAQIRRRVKQARQAGRQDDDLYELYFWGGTAEFYDTKLLDACEEAVAVAADAKGFDQTTAVGDWMADFESNGHALLPHGVDLGMHELHPTECDQVIIRRTHPRGSHFEIVWLASPRHTDIYITTKNLPLVALEAYLAQSQEVLA